MTLVAGSAGARAAAVVVSYNTREDLLRCLASLSASEAALEAVVVDNASADGSAAAVRAAFPDVAVVANAENLGFARANNLGLRATTAPYVLVVNPDAEVGRGTVTALAARLDGDPRAGLVGPRHVDGQGRIQVSFGPRLTPLREWRQRRLVRGVKAGRPRALRAAEEAASRPQEPDWVSGSCFLARRSALEAVGGFDEGYFLYEEDVDLCVRLRAAGYRVLYTPEATVVHHLGRAMAGAGERARLEYHRSHLRYYLRHNAPLAVLGLRALLLARGVASVAAGRPEGRALLRLAVSAP